MSTEHDHTFNQQALKEWARKWRLSHGEPEQQPTLRRQAEDWGSRKTINALRAELTTAIKKNKALKRALEDLQDESRSHSS